MMERPIAAFVEAAGELRRAVRRLRREPGLAGVALVALGLGLGATIALFALVNGVLLRPLGVRAPRELVSVREVIPSLRRQYPSLPVNWRSFEAWRAQARSFSGLALVHPATMDVAIAGSAPRQVVVDQVSANFFELLGTGPKLGRGFAAGEDALGHNHEVVLSYAYWRSAFGAAPDAVGRVLRLDGEPCRIVGVLPAGFEFLRGADWGAFTAAAAAGGIPEIYQPFALDPSGQAVIGNFDWGVLGRLRRGVTAATGEAELNQITANLVASAPQPGVRVVTALTPISELATGGLGPALWLLLAAVGAVLLLVALNLAGLLLVRAHAHAPEAALRQALGASRGRLARAALLEGGLLALGGGGLGLGLAGLILHLLPRWLGSLALPRLESVRLGPDVAVFALLLTVAAGAIFALAPALRWARTDAAEGLRGAGPRGGGGGSRAREILVGAEAAVTAALLIVAGLLLHSFVRLGRIAPGYDAAPKLVLGVDLSGPDAARRDFWRALQPRLQALPGVAQAALTTELPLEGAGVTGQILLAGDTRPLAQRPIANFQFVSPGYFAALGVAVRGREFTPEDAGAHAPPVAVISAAAAADAWPGRDPLGQVFQVTPGGPRLTVVGVARDVRIHLRQAPGPMVFEPTWSDPHRHLAYAILRPRAGADLEALAGAARRAVAEVQPAAAVTSVRTLREVRAAVVAPQRFELLLAVGFGVAALLVAGLGIYGVVAYTLEQRRRELGVRLALGASSRQIVLWVVRRGLGPVVAGLAAALAGAGWLARGLAAQLYGVSIRDPWSYAASALLLLLVGGAACLGPARRALRTDPAAALRE